MILFEDKAKPKTVSVYQIIKDMCFNEIHLIGDSNGYYISSIEGCSPKMITYPDTWQYEKLLHSLRSVKNGAKIRDYIKTFDKLITDNSYNFIKSYINREKTVEYNYYKVFIKLLLMSNHWYKLNKNRKMMFEKSLVPKSIESLGFFFERLYNNLFNNNVEIKKWKPFEEYLLDIDDMFYENKLFIFTPNSYLKQGIDRFNYEYMLTILDRIQKGNGFFIFIDELVYGKKINMLLETSAKLAGRKVQIFTTEVGKNMLLTNL